MIRTRKYLSFADKRLYRPFRVYPEQNAESDRLLLVQASGNVAGLCNWAEAMCTYHAVEKDVAPKIIKLRAAEAELKVAEKEKNAALADLATVQASLDDMQVSKLNAKVSEER